VTSEATAASHSSATTEVTAAERLSVHPSAAEHSLSAAASEVHVSLRTSVAHMERMGHLVRNHASSAPNLPLADV